jgi:hypothetical protein
MASEKLSVIKLVVIGVLVIVGALYLVRVLSWLLSLAIVGAALLGAGFIGYKIAQVVLGGKKETPALPGEAARGDDVEFEFEKDDEFMREMKALEAKERKIDEEIRKMR